jgi:polyhydroxybutyrate depolymerase
MRKYLTPMLLILALLVMPARAQEDAGRSHELFVPSTYNDSDAVPLVVMLHPYGSSGKAMQAITGFDDLAEAEGFLVAYPNADGFTWDDGRSSVVETATPVDDVGYLTDLIEGLQEAYSISKVYLAGFGHGGSMAYRFACDAPQQVDKVLTVGAQFWAHNRDTCDPSGEPVELLAVVGQKDWAAPPDGRSDLGAQEILSHAELEAFWSERNDCGEAETVGDATVYVDCAAPFTLYTPPHIGHHWMQINADYHLNQFDLDMTALAWDFFSGQVLDFAAEINADVAGDEPRGYNLYVPPSYDASEAAPVIIALHGRPSNGYGMAALTDFNPVADEEGFIAVYPHGVAEEWNYTRGNDSYSSNGMDDVQFLRWLVDDLSQDLNIDRSRVYVTGFSNGGFMTQRVACEAADDFAGFAIIGATLFPDFLTLCDGAPARPMLIIHGTADPSVPWAGFEERGVAVIYSVPETVTFWGERNGCTPDSVEITELPNDDDDTRVRQFIFSPCESGFPVEFYAIDGGGHTIPGVPRLDEERFGPTASDIYAPQVIWDYLSQFSLEP